MRESVVMEAPVQASESEGPIWIEALPARNYNTPYYGEVPITTATLDNFITNFRENVRGQEIATDFEHGVDPAKGKKASGWYRDFKVAPSSDDPNTPSLWAEVEFTEEAKGEIKDKKWRYFSLEWRDEWADNDGQKFNDVIVGGALTNTPVAKRTLPINFSEQMWEDMSDAGKKLFADVVMTALRDKNEHKELEHSEPGTGQPPEPRLDEESGVDDRAIKEGWRRETPPAEGTPQEPVATVTKGGKVGEYVFSEKNAHDLLTTLELEGDAKPDDVVTAVKTRVGELSEFQKNQNASEQEKQFAEKYPQFWDEHNKLMKRDRENAALRFSENIKPVRKAEGMGLKTLNEGLSTMALEKVQEVHMKFAEGTATLEDFEEVLKAIMNGGIVKFGELGSNGDEENIPEISTDTAAGIAGNKKLFNELLEKTQAENPEFSFSEAYAATAKKHPDLAQAAKIPLTA